MSEIDIGGTKILLARERLTLGIQHVEVNILGFQHFSFQLPSKLQIDTVEATIKARGRCNLIRHHHTIELTHCLFNVQKEVKNVQYKR